MNQEATARYADPDDTIRQLVRSYLESINQHNLEKNLDELLTIEGGFVERFNFFLEFIPPDIRQSILISGCSAGSELFVAKKFGFKRVVGTEVVPELVQISKSRIEGMPNAQVDLYDGSRLPYKDNEFSVVYSGHIIEHTPSPFAYFKEHFRVLKDGGFLFLEFPNRYHHTELHTGTPSFEWMPTPLRNLCLRVLASKISPYNEQDRKFFRSVRTTLSPVSLWQLWMFMRALRPTSSRFVATQFPAPGFVRVLIQK